MEAILSKEKYIHYCQHNAVPVFYKPAYLDIIYGKEWQAIVVEDGENNVYGMMPFNVKKKLGLKIIIHPKLTPYQGPIIFLPKNIEKQERIYSFRKKILSLIFEKLPHYHIIKIKLHHSITDWQPLMWEGFYQTTRYTYLLDTSINEKSLFENIDSKTKNLIRKAEKELTLENSQNLNEFYNLCLETYERQSIKISFEQKMVEDIYQCTSKSFILIAKYNGEAQAAMLFLYDETYMYGLIAGTKKDTHSGAMALILWNAICKARELGVQYDFEGSDLKHIEPLYRSFGGIQTPYHQLFKSPSRWVDALMILIKKF